MNGAKQVVESPLPPFAKGETRSDAKLGFGRLRPERARF